MKVSLLTPGSIPVASWNAGAYEGLMRIGDPRGARVAHVEMKTRAGFGEAYRDFASRGHRLAFGHEFAYAAASESTEAGTLLVPRVEFMPDGTPMARS